MTQTSPQMRPKPSTPICSGCGEKTERVRRFGYFDKTENQHRIISVCEANNKANPACMARVNEMLEASLELH